jgi:EAL domain-containing protein (putative c-di-GMP-specific phosphodiesterase class I)
MTDTRAVVGTLQQLAQLGVGISLDDFGTGYSPLLHLRRLPLSEVKIDHSFVKTMATNSDDEAVVRSIIGLTHALGLRVVAEGVEDSTVAGLLVEADCDVAQGWHYGRPMRPNDVSAWLARRATTSAQPAPPVAYRNASPDDDHGH